ncbi:MAG: hypothetical protein AAF591_12420 [Verrucomicrobiota bacterium]
MALLPKAALCIGHPGHELRVFKWLHEYKPLTTILTDGSGADRQSRVASTTRILDQAGATPASIYGAYPDRELYRLMLAKDPQPFIDIAERLANEWDDAEIELVAGDMIEGFNTSHDICRLLINAAVDFLRHNNRRSIDNYEFPLEKLSSENTPNDSLTVELSDEDFDLKFETARFTYPELAKDVEIIIDKYGTAPFKTEVLTQASPNAGLTWDNANPPFYEIYGARQVEAGHYSDLITYKEHIQPIALALRSWSRQS